ncbi:hypothetical protein Scep_015576 [Stephania cephalantha]|uniref:Rab3 GTPase-activating protein catalytic subunit n=1 Tax=Stephania cephalantha TaxID=152367 RepID=A0AAP0P2Y0_9MAGN
MASSEKTKSATEGENPDDEELERFDDFTLASSWERFISEIEAACRLWMADGPKNLLDKGAACLASLKNLYNIKFELKYGAKSYSLEYFFENDHDGAIVEWKDDLHDLQLSFGIKEFLVIAPLSASGVILDAPEATKLLSAVAVALSNSGSTWPAFVPIHDPSRKAYIGIQNMGTLLTRRFESDRIGSQVPVRLMHLEGLLTYQTPPYDDEDDAQESEPEVREAGGNPDGIPYNKIQWDDDCPWAEWYSAEDPVRGFQLIAVWSNKVVENSLEMAELENASSHEADIWILSPILSSNTKEVPEGKLVGFASQLRLLVNALDISFEGQFIEDFTSVEKLGPEKLSTSATVPPPTVVDRVLKDLFHEGAQNLDHEKGEHRNSRVIKGAPLESLFAQFCLHALWFGDCNICAIAVLWIEFVREVRWCWEESQPIPRMQTSGSIDLSTCLIHQKLQMLAICIKKKYHSDIHFDDKVDDNSNVFADYKEGSDAGDGRTQNSASTEQFDVKRDSSRWKTSEYSFGTNGKRAVAISDNVSPSADRKPAEMVRKGSAGLFGSMMLLNSYQRMHAPYTQDVPIMTEDMHEERLRAAEALGNAFSFSAQLEKDILTSDMSAFKAANPDAVFEDFIRWHSPGDWEPCEADVSESSMDHKTELNADWPPRGRLSERMSERGNSWRQIWNDAPPLPVSEQKPLLDPNREGEKILHYLETIPPHQLLQQMVCTAFRASAGCLNRTSFGAFEQLKIRIEQLYLTIASTLKPLQATLLRDKNEIIDDLRRLTVVFEHVEKLVILSASIHRKLLAAPRLSTAILGDYFKYYLPRMGMGLEGGNEQEEFNEKQQVKGHERAAIADMFMTPTANQSWRKVLSMGNLLNGHEPILREIIFSKRDNVSDNHYASFTRSSLDHEIETHRMYICGTSNDLQVALSVSSSD